MAAVDRRRADQRYIGAPQTTQAPSLHHHHSMSNPVGAHGSQPPHSIAPHPASGRPGLDRAHTFPTPPTSASSIMGMGNQGSSYEWGGAAVSNMQSNQPLSIDTGLSNARSVPTTPATTPPGAIQNMQQQYQTSQAYDGSRQMYTAPATQSSQYSQQNMVRLGQPLQPSPYPKSEMAPPTRAGESDQSGDHKPHDGLLSQPSEQVGHHGGEDEGDHDHDNEYTHSTAPYNGGRSTYAYNPNASAPSLHGDHPHLSPEMTASPHQNGSGRATPRTTGSQSQWAGYGTPQRAQQPPASNLYSVMSDTRAGANGATGPDSYTAPPIQSSYPGQAYGATNGMTSNKRGRDLDDDEVDPYTRPGSRGVHGDDIDGLKRRKTIREGSVGGAVGSPYDKSSAPIQRTKSMIQRRR